MKAGANSYVASMKSVAEQIADVMKNAFESMTDALAEFVTTGKMNFSDFARSVIADITRIAIRQTIIAPIVGTLFPGPKEAKGGVYSNGIRQF